MSIQTTVHREVSDDGDWTMSLARSTLRRRRELALCPDSAPSLDASRPGCPASVDERIAVHVVETLEAFALGSAAMSRHRISPSEEFAFLETAALLIRGVLAVSTSRPTLRVVHQ